MSWLKMVSNVYNLRSKSFFIVLHVTSLKSNKRVKYI